MEVLEINNLNQQGLEICLVILILSSLKTKMLDLELMLNLQFNLKINLKDLVFNNNKLRALGLEALVEILLKIKLTQALVVWD